MKLVKKSSPGGEIAAPITAPFKGLSMGRRAFLRRSGVAVGGAAVASMIAPAMVKKAKAAASLEARKGETTTVRSICTHCSVGCGIYAEVQNGVWTGQEPAFDHPFNLGAHCAKGASVREHGHGSGDSSTP